MFKLVVLSALLAVAAAKPGVWPLAHVAHVAPVVHALPAAVSHTARYDVHHSAPIIAAPVHHAVAAPLALAPHTPATVLSPWGVPLDTADVVAARALHYQAKALHSYAPYHHLLKKRSIYAAPLVHALPSAVSHQSRVDVHHSVPVVSHYAAPWVAPYSAPLISHHGLWAPHAAYGVHPW